MMTGTKIWFSATRCISLVLITLLSGCKQQGEKSVNELIVKTAERVEAGTFELLLERSGLEKKNLFLVFSFQGCSVCRIFEKYHADPVVSGILDQYFIVSKIDYYKTPEGKELYGVYGKPGFPSWTIIDSAKNVIADSGNLKGGTGNIGFPHSEPAREFYISALKKAAVSLTAAERGVLLKKLKEYRPDSLE